MLKFSRIAILFVSLVTLSSCFQPRNDGYLFPDGFSYDKSLKVGMSKFEVEGILGSPSLTKDNSYFYISLVRKRRVMLSPKVVERTTLKITFDETDHVYEIKNDNYKNHSWL